MTFDEIDALIGEMEALQIGKVFDLARRLKPGLTLEDMRNPHDFPELGDPDWHYEDGILTGIQSVRTAMRARSSASSSLDRNVETMTGKINRSDGIDPSNGERPT